MIKNKIFIARSGKPLSITSQNNTKDSLSQNPNKQISTLENLNTKDSILQANLNNTQSHTLSITQHNRDSLILNPDNTQEYFDYSKQRQKDKDKGAIPEGIYYIDITQSKDDKQSGIREYNNAWYSFSRSKEGEKQWGKYNIPIYTDKDCTNTTESSTKRQGFYIHGGESYGDNGGIDLSKEDTRFFRVLESLKQEYKDILEYIKDDKGRIIIKLEVGYGERKSEIDLREKSGGKVKWFSQFEPPVPDYGNAACFRASKYTVQQAGVKDVSGPYEKTLQIAKEIKKANTQTGYLSIDVLKAKQAVKYINEQLENAYPIVVGVDHTYGNTYNADKTTDHFIVIVGRKYDEKGKLYYLFYEVGTHSINEKTYQWGTSDNNKLYIQSNFVLSGQTQMGSKKNYIVTQVRVNIN